MRQNSIQNRLQMISMEEYLEKRQKIRETERKRDKKTVCRQQDRGGNGSHQKLLRDNAVYKSKDECADVKKNQQDCSDQCHDTF